MKHLFLLFTVTVIMISCSKSDSSMQVMNNITYTGNVKAILDNNCLNCHGNPTANGAPMSLTNFDEAKEAVSNRDLIGRVENGSMPIGSVNLTTAEVQIIKDWEAGGFKP